MSNCELCSHYYYDEDYEQFFCDVNTMDEDDFVRLTENENSACPYFTTDDEYSIVRKQM